MFTIGDVLKHKQEREAGRPRYGLAAIQPVKPFNYRRTVSLLTAALVDAEVAHAEYEKTLGHRDDNWAVWYAEYLAKNGVTI